MSRSAQQQTAVWNAVAGLFSQGKGEARAKVLESIPPVPVSSPKKLEVSLFCLTLPHPHGACALTSWRWRGQGARRHRGRGIYVI